jgi:hypothetical protein
VPVGLRSSRTDAPLFDRKPGQRVGEGPGPVLGAVVGDDGLEAPASAGEFAGDAADER